MCKIGTFQRNLSTMFRKILNIYLVLKIFQNVRVATKYFTIFDENVATMFQLQ